MALLDHLIIWGFAADNLRQHRPAWHQRRIDPAQPLDATGCGSATKVAAAFNQMNHLGSCVRCRTVVGEARSGRDVGGHLPRQVELVIGTLRQQRDDEVLQRDHANSKLRKFDFGRCYACSGAPFRDQRAAFGRRELTWVCRIHCK